MNKLILIFGCTILAVACVAGATIGISGVVVRNHVATGHPSIDIVTSTSDWLKPWAMSPAQFVKTYIPRSLFVFGWTGPMAPYAQAVVVPPGPVTVIRARR